MGSNIDRKQAIREYKARKAPPRGIFAVRCTATGQLWIASSMNLDAAQNSAWFSLRNGLYPNKSIQAEWNTHGDRAFVYEILEKLEDDVSAIQINDVLKAKKRYWMDQLGAQTMT